MFLEDALTCVRVNETWINVTYELFQQLFADSAGQLYVLKHDGDVLGVDGAQIGVFKQTTKISFASFLKSHHSGALETQFGLEILSDFSHKTLEGQLADQQLSGFLVTTDLTKSGCTKPVSVASRLRGAQFHHLIHEQFALYEPFKRTGTTEKLLTDVLL